MENFFVYLVVMAGVTYLIRAIPLTVFRGKVKNKFIKSFLAYIPYSVLASMTFPAIFYSTGSIISGVAGTVTGFILAYKRKSLLFVAIAACVVSLLFALFQQFVINNVTI